MPALAPWLATRQPVKCERGAGNGAVLHQRLQAISRASGLKTACVAKPGAEQQAVGFDYRYQCLLRQAPDG